MEDGTQFAKATENLFECLKQLYAQARQLLWQCDEPMRERGWKPTSDYALQNIPFTIHSPEKWFARWAARFYMRRTVNEEDETVKELRFVSIHFCSDEDTQVVEPLVIAGTCVLNAPLQRKEVVQTNRYYWLCKSLVFVSRKIDRTPGEWYEWDPSKLFPEGKVVRSFDMPLHSIKSSKELKEKVIDKLFSE